MPIYFSEILVLALFHPHFLRDLLGKSSQVQPGLALGPPAGARSLQEQTYLSHGRGLWVGFTP
jgi:hypothetical protein